MIQKDLNLFTAYKKHTSDSGARGYKSIIFISIVFVLVVLISYGALFFMKSNVKTQIDDIKSELSKPEVSELQKILAGEIKTNELMVRYRKGLELALKKYDQSRKIDTELYNTLVLAAPNGTEILYISIDAVSININCTSASFDAPGLYAQELKSKGIFTSVVFDSVKLNSDGRYEYKLSLGFKGEESK